MQPRPSFDRELLFVIAGGVVSILGLGWIFFANFRSHSPILPTVEPTSISFDVSPLESGTLTPSPSATPTLEETLPTATGTSPDVHPTATSEALAFTSTLITESPPTPSATPTPDPGQLLPAGKHDDTHPKIAYDRFWAFKMNSGTKYAYKGTLHISANIGNELSFRFEGQQFYLGYQRGRSFGTVTVMIDDQPYRFHEQAFGNIWRSPELTPGMHSVRLIHENGESINLDYIEILS